MVCLRVVLLVRQLISAEDLYGQRIVVQRNG